ncbi:MAG TPA: ABC transporter permease [Streptosporangiaceae bacterium]|nr:ABC transporter permease [Streptosporangiaceae bacterium]
MRAALYLWRATAQRSWRTVLTVAVIGGLFGAVALGALAGARRTSSAYGRYLVSIKASDAFVNVPGAVPGGPVTEPIRLIAALPGITASDAYIGLDANPVVHGRIRDSFLTNSLTGSFNGAYFTRDRMTVVAGRLPRLRATREIALSPGIARLFGVGVGGQVTYQLYRQNPVTYRSSPGPRITFRVTGIADIPPVLVDQSDEQDGAVVPPGATRQLLPSYVFSWVGVKLDHGTAGIGALQHHLATLATSVQRRYFAETHQKLPGLTFAVARSDVVRREVQQAIGPQVVALAVFGGIAALAMLVLAGQGLAQLISRSVQDISVVRALGGGRAQTALAASLPGVAAIAGATVLAVAGAIALSPLAPVGQVRQFDPARGFQADVLVLGAGSVLLAAILLAALAVMAARATRQAARPVRERPSAVAHAAAAAGLPASAVVASRNALEPGSGRQAVPVRATLLGSIAAVTAVIAAAVFGASLTGLVTNPARYGWNWQILIQAEGGYGNFSPSVMNRLVGGQPTVAAWSSFGFSQVAIDGRVVPVLGLQRDRGSLEPPTSSGQAISDNGQIELGAVTLRQLGKKVGDTVLVGRPPYRRPLTISGIVTLPSFGVAISQHVSLGQGAMLSEQALLAVQGLSSVGPQSAAQSSQAAPSAVAIDLVPGTSAAQRAALVHRITSANPDGTPGGTYELMLHHARAAAIVNATQMGGQPLALALSLAAAAMLSLALTVLTSVRRRRRELALLKTLGMTRLQLRAIVAWQTTLTLLIALVVGVPLGVAAGRWAWSGFAGSLGVAPVTVVPVLLLAAGCVVVVLAGNLLASVPAAMAARTPAAGTLRTE